MAQRVTLAGEDLGEFDFAALTLKDLFAIKAASGLTGGKFGEGVGDMDPTALGALVWFQRWKQGKPVAIESIDFAIRDLKLEEIEGPKAPEPTPSQSSEDGTSEPSLTFSDSPPPTSTD